MVSLGAHWCLRVPTNVGRCLWVSDVANWYLKVSNGI